MPAILGAWTALAPQVASDHVELMIGMVEASERGMGRLDSRTVRARAAEFAAVLAEQNVPQAEAKSVRLAELGLRELPSAWPDLLRLPHAEALLSRVEELVDLERSISILGVAVNQASARIASLQRFQEAPDESLRERLNVKHSLETVLAVYRPSSPTLQFRTQFTDDAWVLAQPDSLMQVWNHLLQNALQALGEQGTVEIVVRREGRNVLISVADDGPGIDPDVQQWVLEPFVHRGQDDAPAVFGLEIVRTVVEAHGGALSLESQPGRTVFTVALPAARDD